MKVRNVKSEYFGRRFVIKEGNFSPVDTSNSNVLYVGKLKTDRYNNCEVLRYYIFDNLPVKTVVIYIPERDI